MERKDLQTRVVIAVASLVLAKLANLAVPLVLGWAVDTLSNLEDQTDLIFGIPFAALAAYGLSRLSYIVFNEIRDAVFARVSQHAVRQVAIKVFSHLHALSTVSYTHLTLPTNREV